MGIKKEDKIINQVLEASPSEAFEVLSKDENAILIDVRTSYEWENVGVPYLSSFNKEVIKISWKLLPEMSLNVLFNDELQEKVLDKEFKLYFICRSGGRSYEAARSAIQLGFNTCYNVIGGFEGHGENVGWKYAGLPWRKN